MFKIHLVNSEQKHLRLVSRRTRRTRLVIVICDRAENVNGSSRRKSPFGEVKTQKFFTRVQGNLKKFALEA
jgi:hypothetical protein